MGIAPHLHTQEQAGQGENIPLPRVGNCQGEKAASEYLISQLTEIQSQSAFCDECPTEPTSPFLACQSVLIAAKVKFIRKPPGYWTRTVNVEREGRRRPCYIFLTFHISLQNFLRK